jgi:hypothetical protein
VTLGAHLSRLSRMSRWAFGNGGALRTSVGFHHGDVVLGLLTPPTADCLAYLHTVVLHRCSELSDRDLALLAAEPDDTLPRQIAEQVLTVLAALEQRLDELTAIVRDDGDHDRRADRRARQAGEGDLVSGR